MYHLIRPFWFSSGVCVKDWSGNPFFEERKKRLERKAWWAFWRKRPSIFLYSSFSLSWNKETKFKAVSNHAKNRRLSSRRFELAALKHQIVFAHARAFDAPLFFTHHLIRPFGEIFGFENPNTTDEHKSELKIPSLNSASCTTA